MIGIDVYGLLERFAVKSQSPAIEVGIFVKALQSYAQRNEDELPEMDEWAAKPAELFRENIIPYEKQKKVKFFTDVRGMEQVFLPEIFVTMLSNDYAMVENDTSLPFPDEKKYEGVVPPEFLRQIDVYDELNVYFERPQSTNLPILKLVLHNSLSGIFVLAPDLPRRVLEIAIIKIRAFLRTHGNSEFYTHRLTASSEGRANLIKDMINQIESRPVECVTEIESGADNINIFWLNFCSSVRSQFELKTNFENEDVAVMQSIVIIEALCSYYKVNAVYQRNKTLGLQALESKLRHTPFYHTLDDIMNFTNAQGKKLLDQYKQKDLQDFLTKKTTPLGDESLPEILIFVVQDSTKYFIYADQLMMVCINFLHELKPQVRQAVINYWSKSIKAFQKTSSMQQDDEYETLIRRYSNQLSPILMSILASPVTAIVQEEALLNKTLPMKSRMYDERGILLPVNHLIQMERKEMLNRVKMLLPVWYSIPFIYKLLSLFMRKKYNKAIDWEDSLNMGAYKTQPGADGGADGRVVVQQYQRSLVPTGETLDTYISKLENNWPRIMDEASLQTMKSDIHKLINGRLRSYLRLQPLKNFSRKDIDDLAITIYHDTGSLQKLGTKPSMILYIKLIIFKNIFAVR